MINWITVATFTYPHEAQMLKARLESEGLNVIVKDELTTQVYHFLSPAVGGVKLQVPQEELESALRVLKDAGYPEDQSTEPSALLLAFERSTSQWPLIGKSPLIWRFLILITLMLLFISIPLALLLIPSTEERLSDHKSWCMDQLVFEGKNYEPNTLGLRLVLSNGCSETMVFRESGYLLLPGIDSKNVYANWSLEEDKLVIFDADTLTEIYEGVYEVEIDDYSMTLQSEKTIIKGHPAY